MQECNVVENCKNYGKCELCNDQDLYWMIKTGEKYLSDRQIRERDKKKLLKKIQKDSDGAKRARRSRRKGRQGEKEVEKELQQLGLDCYRVPLSGALKGERFSGDIRVKIRDIERIVEVKRRGKGHKTLYKYLEQDNADYAFLRDDNEEWLVVMKIDRFKELV